MGRQHDESKVFWHFAFFNGRYGIALVSALVYWLRLARLPTGATPWFGKWHVNVFQ